MAIKLEDARKSVGWLNTVGPLATSPVFKAQETGDTPRASALSGDAVEKFAKAFEAGDDYTRVCVQPSAVAADADLAALLDILKGVEQRHFQRGQRARVGSAAEKDAFADGMAVQVAIERLERQTRVEQGFVNELLDIAAWIRTPGNVNHDDAIDDCARVLENRARQIAHPTLSQETP